MRCIRRRDGTPVCRNRRRLASICPPGRPAPMVSGERRPCGCSRTRCDRLRHPPGAAGHARPVAVSRRGTGASMCGCAGWSGTTTTSTPIRPAPHSPVGPIGGPDRAAPAASAIGCGPMRSMPSPAASPSATCCTAPRQSSAKISRPPSAPPSIAGSPPSGWTPIRACAPPSSSPDIAPSLPRARSSVAPRTAASCRCCCWPRRSCPGEGGRTGRSTGPPNASACRSASMPDRRCAMPSPRSAGRPICWRIMSRNRRASPGRSTA